MFEVLKPASKYRVELVDGLLQAVSVGAPCMGSDPVTQLLDAALSGPALPSFKMISEEVEAPCLAGIHQSRLFRMQLQTSGLDELA